MGKSLANKRSKRRQINKSLVLRRKEKQTMDTSKIMLATRVHHWTRRRRRTSENKNRKSRTISLRGNLIDE